MSGNGSIVVAVVLLPAGCSATDDPAPEGSSLTVEGAAPVKAPHTDPFRDLLAVNADQGDGRDRCGQSVIDIESSGRTERMVGPSAVPATRQLAVRAGETHYDALKADPSLAIPAGDVRAGCEAKWAARS